MKRPIIAASAIMCVVSLSFSHNAYPQGIYQKRLSIKLENQMLETALDKISEAANVPFAYDARQMKGVGIKKQSFSNAPLKEVLQKLLDNTAFEFKEFDNSIIVYAMDAQKLVSATYRNGTVFGRVTERSSGESLPGVLIKVVGTNVSTTTDNEGTYRIALKPGSYLLHFHFIGCADRDLPIKIQSGQNNNLDVALYLSTTALEKAVVIGYGTRERRDLIGSVSSYKPSEESGALPLSIDRAMVGKLPGVYIAPSSGIPGSASSITIRGISTLNNGGNSPLIVIDGVPVYGIDKDLNTTSYGDGSGVSFAFGGTAVADNFKTRSIIKGTHDTFEKNPLATLSPGDIESIEILKDSYATAIYGSRGAAGVILITTKKGSQGKIRINAQISSSVSSPFDRQNMMNGDQYTAFYNAYYNAKNPDENTTIFPAGINTNWLDKVTHNATGTDVNVSVSGGNEKSNYYISTGYNRQESYIINNDFTRYQGRINAQHELSRLLTVGTNISLNHTDNRSLNAQTVYRNAVLKSPNLPVYKETGEYMWGFGDNPIGPDEDMNPVALAMTGHNYAIDNRILGNIYADLDLAPWLKFRSEFGVDWINGRSYRRVVDKPHTIGGSAAETTNQNRKWVINNTLTFDKALGTKHALNGVIGQSFETSTENILSVTGKDFLKDGILSISAAGERRVARALQQEWALTSYFGRLNYIFDNRYMAGVTYRIDGSSRFARNRRYVGFPSFALGWIISNEPFMENAEFIDQLKIRSSLGFTGTDGGGGYYGNQGQYRLSVYGATYGDVGIIGVSQPNNPNLEWERTRTLNIGADITLFKSRLNITFDYYNKQITNAILPSAVPGFMGFTTQEQNLADLNNRGWELALNTTNVSTKNFQWLTYFNISRNRNRVIRLHEITPEELAKDIESSGGNYLIPGHSATTFWMYEWGGVDPATGNPIWVDKEGQKLTNPIQEEYDPSYLHRKAMGDALPELFGGFGNTFYYKGFELDAFFSFALGHKMFNGAKAALYSYAGSSFFGADVHNLSTDMLAYWKSEGQQTDIPALLNASNTAGSFFSTFDYTLGRNISRFLEDASFLKLRNVTLAYSLGQNALSRLRWSGISSAKLFVQASNVFVWTKYSGIDPEVSAFGSSALNAGYDELTMPAPRTFSVGLKLGF